MKSIAQLLVQHQAVKVNFQNPFTWVSGIRSPIYCDCRELISIPEAREVIVEAFLEEIELLSSPLMGEDEGGGEKKSPLPSFPSHGGRGCVVAGTATAGIPWAAFVAQKLNLPMLYVRPKPKEHGAGKMVEGKCEKNKNILVVEDALSTAGSSVRSAEALRSELNATVTDILAIFSWDTPQAGVNAEKAKLNLHPLTKFDEIAECLLEMGKITEEEKESLERFHKDPAGWYGNV
ncbi:orotate phosphoribosyltransferase, partial [Candidatus Gracilibacteria bacterium]|nr:orotate phosphoribosyltransferase [Candidatus Gracilibacteria bacterium]